MGVSKAEAIFDKVQSLPDSAQAVVLRVVEQLSVTDVGENTESASPLTRRFQELATQWRTDTAYFSFMQQRAMHSAYQQIIGLGWPVVPLLLRELERQPEHWFWALQAITGEQPASRAETTAATTDAWLKWGRERGIVPNANS